MVWDQREEGRVYHSYEEHYGKERDRKAVRFEAAASAYLSLLKDICSLLVEWEHKEAPGSDIKVG